MRRKAQCCWFSRRVSKSYLSAVLVVALACASEAPPTSTWSSGEKGVAAKVGEQRIVPALVQAVSRHGRVSPRAAVDALVSDAVFAERFRREHAEWAEAVRRVGLARVLTERLEEATRAQGPPTEEEVAVFTERHWWELDRPGASRVTHAVILAEGEEERRRARLVAERLHTVLENSHGAEQFRSLAETFDTEGLRIKVEELLPVASDGRAFDPSTPPPPDHPVQRFARRFAQAANAIPRVLDVSPVVETDFGFHVLLLTERLPPLRTDRERRRALLAREIYDARAREALAEILNRSREHHSVEIRSSALSLTEGLRVAP